jgi:hypothetical protein
LTDAPDRSASFEIGYLSQRLEPYNGFTVLTANRPCNIDEAFCHLRSGA